MKSGVVVVGAREVERRGACGKRAAASLTRAAHERVGLLEPGDADAHVGEVVELGARSKPGASASIIRAQLVDVARHRPGVVEARREREAAVERARARTSA